MSEPSLVVLGPTPPPPRRRRYVVVGAVTLAVMLVAGAAAVPMLTEAGPRRGEASAPGLGTVRTYADLSIDHTDGDVDYPMTPPAGGPHDPVWLECGAYDVPVRDENAVHDLEHGAVWISYDPGLSDADVRRLEGLLPQNGIMAPYPGLPAAVVVTVWGRQLRLDAADDERLERFVADFGQARPRRSRAPPARAGPPTPRAATSPRAPPSEARVPVVV